MDQAYPIEKLIGPRSRPQLSAMLNRPLSFPRILDETRVVDAITSTRVSYLVGLATGGEEEGGGRGSCFLLASSFTMQISFESRMVWGGDDQVT